MGKKILLIEDEESIRHVFQKQLEEIGGYEVIPADGGKEGVDILETSDLPDIILLDLVMPEIDGIGVLKFLNNDKEKYSKIPVIILTNVTSQETRDEVAKFDVKDYIVKTSILPNDLIAKIEQAMSS